MLLNICIVLYIALLPWPLYVAFAYMLFSGRVKTLSILFVFAAELALGAFLAARQFKKMRAEKKAGPKIAFGLILAGSLIYAATSVIYLIRYY